MTVTSAKLIRKSISQPDEVRSFEGDSGDVKLVNLGDAAAGLGTFQPGWRWSTHVKPIAKTDTCQAAHVGYVISGRMRVEMTEGDAQEFGPGDFMNCPPGHDAWIVGDEPCVIVDWQGFADYAKRTS